MDQSNNAIFCYNKTFAHHNTIGSGGTRAQIDEQQDDDKDVDMGGGDVDGLRTAAQNERYEKRGILFYFSFFFTCLWMCLFSSVAIAFCEGWLLLGSFAMLASSRSKVARAIAAKVCILSKYSLFLEQILVMHIIFLVSLASADPRNEAHFQD